MTPSRRRILIYLAGALLLVAVALLAVTCSGQQKAEKTSVETVPTTSDLGVPGSGSLTATPDATATPQSVEPSPTSKSSGGLSASEAAALEAELSAMEQALDSMGLPGDEDFKDIESGLQ